MSFPGHQEAVDTGFNNRKYGVIAPDDAILVLPDHLTDIDAALRRSASLNLGTKVIDDLTRGSQEIIFPGED